MQLQGKDVILSPPKNKNLSDKLNSQALELNSLIVTHALLIYIFYQIYFTRKAEFYAIFTRDAHSRKYYRILPYVYSWNKFDIQQNIIEYPLYITW